MVDMLERVFYHGVVHASQIGSILRARCRDPRRQLARGQRLTPAGKVVAGAVLIHPLAGKPNLRALEAARASGQSDNELDESCRQTLRMPIKAEPDQRLPQLRRGEHWGWAPYEMLPPMQADNADPEAPTVSTEGVSAFVARVLDQLALSAWLPAAFLTAGVAVLLEFRSTKMASIPNAVEKLTAHSVAALVIMLPLLVIATVITQAFSFEAIRALEGYWGRGRIANIACRLMTWRHVHRKNAIIERRLKESERAFRAALPDMALSDDDVTGRILKAVVAELSGRDSGASQLEGRELQVFVNTLQTWRDRAEAWRLTKIDRLLNEQRSYPVDSRILPTKLGNLLRATEDDLEHAGGDVRSFVLRRRNTVPRRVQVQHDQFRTRLDMYCTLVFVSAVLAILAPVALVGRVNVLAVAVTTVSFVVMAVVSYLAAIASASGYCTALRQMDESARAPDEK
jgi:hypothetical protein